MTTSFNHLKTVLTVKINKKYFQINTRNTCPLNELLSFSLPEYLLLDPCAASWSIRVRCEVGHKFQLTALVSLQQATTKPKTLFFSQLINRAFSTHFKSQTILHPITSSFRNDTRMRNTQKSDNYSVITRLEVHVGVLDSITTNSNDNSGRR